MADVAARWSSARQTFGHARNAFGRVGAVEVTVGLLGAGLVVLLISTLYGSPPRSTTKRPTELSAATPPIEGSSTHVNELGGFSFEPPVGWTVRDRGSASELTSPDADVVMSFGSGREGSLQVAAQALLDSIRRGYLDVRTGTPEESHVGGRPAVVVSGDLLNASGVRVRFLGLALRVAGENRVIAVFASEPADPARILPAVEQVIDSFSAA